MDIDPPNIPKVPLDWFARKTVGWIQQANPPTAWQRPPTVLPKEWLRHQCKYYGLSQQGQNTDLAERLKEHAVQEESGGKKQGGEGTQAGDGGAAVAGEEAAAGAAAGDGGAAVAGEEAAADEGEAAGVAVGAAAAVTKAEKAAKRAADAEQQAQKAAAAAAEAEAAARDAASAAEQAVAEAVAAAEDAKAVAAAEALAQALEKLSLTESEAGKVHRMEERIERVQLLPSAGALNLVTFNVLSLTPATMHALLDYSKAAWAMRPDVICLQEVKRPDAAHAETFSMLRGEGYSYVKAGEQVILWSTDTMERVATTASLVPDYVWRCHDPPGGLAALQDGAPVPRLDEAWKGMHYYTSDKQYILEDLQVAGKNDEHLEGTTFFRHPPITVVLQRRATKTLYVITTAHTPGGTGSTALNVRNKRQLQREVKWLLDPTSHRAALADMVTRGPHHSDLQQALGGNPLMPSIGSKPQTASGNDIVHIVCGDFNAQIYRYELPKECKDDWLAVHGSMASASVPTLYNDANNSLQHFADVMYLYKGSVQEASSVPRRIVCNFHVPPIPNSAAAGHARYWGSNHRPLFVSLTETKNSPMAAPIPRALNPCLWVITGILARLPNAPAALRFLTQLQTSIGRAVTRLELMLAANASEASTSSAPSPYQRCLAELAILWEREADM